MSRRVAQICRVSREAQQGLPWAGTFHGIANRLLRLYARELGLDPGFTLLDREDSADLLDRLRHEQGLSHTRTRFPRKGTCLAIYSHAVNTQRPLRDSLEGFFPWCIPWQEELRGAVRRATSRPRPPGRCWITTICCCTGFTS